MWLSVGYCIAVYFKFLIMMIIVISVACGMVVKCFRKLVSNNVIDHALLSLECLVFGINVKNQIFFL